MKKQFTLTFRGTECFSVSSNLPPITVDEQPPNAQKSLFCAGFSDGALRVWDFDELINGEGATLDKPKHTIEGAFNVGPADVKLSPDGTKVAASSVDNSIKIFSLQEESKESDEAGLLCEVPAEIAESWKLDFCADSKTLVTGQMGLVTLSL